MDSAFAIINLPITPQLSKASKLHWLFNPLPTSIRYISQGAGVNWIEGTRLPKFRGENPKNLSLRFMARKFWRGSFLRLSNILPFYSHSIFQCRRNYKGVDRCSTFYGNVPFHVAIALRLFNALEKIYLGSSSITYNRRMPFYSGLDSIPYPFCLPGDHSLYLPKCLNPLFNGNL